VEESVLSVLFRWGYREVTPPIFEYLDVLSSGLSEDLLRKSYKFVDRESGRMMILRPDITPQIARMVAGNLFGQPKPLRLCYHGNIFRYEEPHAGHERENFQVGAELIGSDSLRADVEVLSIAVECLQQLGLGDFRLSIGHAGFLRGLLSAVDTESEAALFDLIKKRDFSGIEAFFEGGLVSHALRPAFLRLPYLFGGEEVLTEAAGLVKDDDPFREIHTALAELREVYRLLCLHGYQEYILLDLGEVRDLDYYTGIFFEVFREGVGYPLGRGGRYNRLIAKFGSDCPSTGLAFEVETLVRLLPLGRIAPRGQVFDFLVVDFTHDGNEAVLFARSLRSLGFSAAIEVMNRTLEEALIYAGEMLVGMVLFLGMPGMTSKDLLAVDMSSDERRIWRKEDFLSDGIKPMVRGS
jgi:ATP phosphoribosyltransferase regulatory subunit